MDYIVKFSEMPIFETGYVQLWDFSRNNECKASRIETVSLVASVCYDKQGKILDPEKLYEHLYSKNQSSLEFIRSEYNEGIQLNISNSFRNVKFTYSPTNEFFNDHVACFKLRVPLKVIQQLLRHRQFSFQQKSFRYVTIKESDLYINKKMLELNIKSYFEYLQTIQGLVNDYYSLISAGINQSDARDILPQCIFSEIWLMGEVEGLKNFFRERLGKGAMHETKLTAKFMQILIKKHQPGLFNKLK